MKKMKTLILFVLVAAMSVGLFCFPAGAAERPDEIITFYEDGSYSVTTIEIDETRTSRASTNSISGNKSRKYYSSDNELLWSLTVYGTFTYDGSSAEATDADYSYSIYASDWSFKSGSAFYSGAKATAKGTFKHGLTSNSASVSLTCAADGTLS